jgi:hypothetical protein
LEISSEDNDHLPGIGKQNIIQIIEEIPLYESSLGNEAPRIETIT